MAPQKKTSALAIAGLVLGILAALGCFLPIINNLSIVLALIGGILSVVALLGALKGKNSSKGLAIAGLVLAVLSVVISLVMQAVYAEAINEALSDSPSSATVTTQSLDTETDTSTEPTGDEEGAATEPAASEETDYQHMAIGDGVTFEDGLSVVLNSVQTGLHDYDGDPVTCINVTYVNNGTETAPFNSYDWKGEDASGVQRGVAFYLDGSDEIDSGSLSAGGSVTGNVYLEGDLTRVIYQHNIFLEDSQVGWVVE